MFKDHWFSLNLAFHRGEIKQQKQQTLPLFLLEATEAYSS